MSVLFIGGGNMGRALAGGLIALGREPQSIAVVEIDRDARTRLEQDLHVRGLAGIADVDPDHSDVIVLAVKPQSMQDAAHGLASRIGSALVISIAAGIRVADLERWLGGYRRIIRAMPNTPALVRRGMTGLYAGSSITEDERRHADDIMGAVGETIWCKNEHQLDAITGLSGSGPAYLFYFLESMIAAGESLGFDPGDARRLAYATASGSMALAQHSTSDPSMLRAQVTSKGGTTEAAIALLERRAVKDALIDAVRAAAARANELGDSLGKDA